MVNSAKRLSQRQAHNLVSHQAQASLASDGVLGLATGNKVTMSSIFSNKQGK
eukprot:TRINITY_DN3306_c1_g4_i1.p3 TRINITY_DN3306_c1_g4~~TRINITY_DN3306_c1_g4_i1.p3  ORF type:complete len:52 (-),score=0.49 TRINITY_DN3306_c1_g4_i1:61-216(-)